MPDVPSVSPKMRTRPMTSNGAPLDTVALTGAKSRQRSMTSHGGEAT